MARKPFRIGWILLLLGLSAIATLRAWLSIERPLYPDPQAIPSAANPDPSSQWAPATDRARSLLRAAVVEQNLPGLSIAVGVNGELVWAEGFGWADVEARAPITPDTRFRLGTASTALTSAAVGLLLEQGRLALDDEIQTHVPQFPRKPWPVTLRQLIANSSGLATDSEDDGRIFRQRCEQPSAAVPYFADDPLLFEPGTQRRPSNYGWILVSAAVESAADQPFLAFTRERIFQPLGMNHTGAESATEENPERIGEPAEDAPFLTFFRQLVLEPLGVAPTRAKSPTEPATIYERGFGYDPVVGYGLHVMRPLNLSCYAGALAFFSTPSDLVRFGLALESGKLLQPATAQDLQIPAALDGDLLGHKVVSLKILRDPGIVVAITANFADADTSALALQVAEAFAQAER